MKRVGIIGAGPVGSVLAAALATAGHEVTLVEVSGQVRDRISERGIRITGARDMYAPPELFPDLFVRVDALADDPPDILFVVIKATVLPLVSSSIAEFAGDQTTVVSWQNGIDTERIIADAIGAETVVRAVVNYGVSYSDSLDTYMTFEHPPHYVQELVPEGEHRAAEVASTLSAAGIATQRAFDLVSMVWKKSILNASLNGLCAITGLRVADAVDDVYARTMMDNILKESIAVARANEIRLGWRFYQWARDYNEKVGPHKPSMLLDMEAGRRSEVDFINGKIVDYGHIAGVPTPYNESILCIMKALEKRL